MKHPDNYMEQSLFTWTGWDGEYECMIFYDATLVVPIGEFPVGKKFVYAAIHHNKSLLSFHDNDNKEYVFNLKYQVGDMVETVQHPTE